MDEKNKQKKLIAISALIAVFVVVLGISYAYFLAQGQSAEQTITTASLGLEFDDNTAIINKDDISPLVREVALPTQDSTGKVTTAGKAATKEFTITNTGDKKLFVNISLEDITLGTPDPENSNIPKLQRYDFLWSLYEVTDKTNNIEKNVSNGSFEYVENSVDIGKYLVFEAPETSGDVTTYDEKTYKLYIWIEETSIDQSYMMGQEFKATIKAVGEEYWTSPESDFSVDEWGGLSYNGPGGNVSIPPVINGETVTYINGYAFSGKGITNIIIPNTIDTILMEAFVNNQLTELFIPSSVNTIDWGAFSGNQLTSVSIPNSVTNIGESAFSNNNIKSVVIPNSITKFEQLIFSNNELTNIIIPNSVTEIDMGPFSNNKLTSIVVPSNVTTIMGDFINGNKDMKEIVLLGKKEIPSGFYENWNLIDVIYGDSDEPDFTRCENIIYK